MLLLFVKHENSWGYFRGCVHCEELMIIETYRLIRLAWEIGSHCWFWAIMIRPIDHVHSSFDVIHGDQ